MKYIDYDMNAYNLHVIKTDKFKTITVDVCFRRKIKKEEITIRNLLKEMMIDASYNYPNETSLVVETENLYDLKLVASGYRVGNDSILSFKAKFLNEKYTEPLMNSESIKFLLDIIFNPLFGDNINKCKEKISKGILSIKDNKIKYSLFKLLEKNSDKPYSYNDYGYLEDLKDISVSSLRDYYNSVISDDIIDVFVVGDVSEEFIKNIFRDNFKAKTYHKDANSIIAPELDSNKKVESYQETDNVNQTQIALLCRINSLTDNERKYVLPIYSEMLGGSSNSILFDTVREKNSYAYYVNAIAKPYDNVMMIYSGIEYGKSDEVYKLILKCLKDINHGKFDESKLENAKNTFCSAIMASTDMPTGLINNAYAKVLVGSLEIDERIKKIKNVSKNDVINLSKKINVYSKFVLEASNERD